MVSRHTRLIVAILVLLGSAPVYHDHGSAGDTAVSASESVQSAELALFCVGCAAARVDRIGPVQAPASLEPPSTYRAAVTKLVPSGPALPRLRARGPRAPPAAVPFPRNQPS